MKMFLIKRLTEATTKTYIHECLNNGGWGATDPNRHTQGRIRKGRSDTGVLGKGK